MTTIRPPDTGIATPTLRYMPIASHEATRRLVHLAFRDAHTALDLTYAHRGFWRDPLPPGLRVTSNNLDATADTDLHLDFTATGLPDESYGLAVYDPPHIADGGEGSIMARRFGTVKGTAALRELIQAGAREAWRISRVGILVKLCNSSHGGELMLMADWVKQVIPVPVYDELHTYRRSHVVDVKHRAYRVTRSNGAHWLVLRHQGHRHIDFDALYERQQQARDLGAVGRAS